MSTITEPSCYVIVRRGTTILFLMREHTGFMDGTYTLPAGRVEEGETYAEGAAREALEEVGIEISVHDLSLAYTMHRYSDGSPVKNRTDVFFEVADWKGEPVNAEPDKHSEMVWLPVDELPAHIMDYQRAALLEIASGKSYGEYGWQGIEKID